MAKNILIFSDGTGQAGGIKPDQRLSNIYKLFRATRVGPDSPIDPRAQVAFYSAGLGSDPDARGLPFRFVRAIHKFASSATGVGISTNITDCYEAILKHYEPGDRIFIFGFSRGAYTARCVAGVLNLCGVPTRTASLPYCPRYGPALRAIADEAVGKVYEHGAGKQRAKYELEREEKARRFREKYGCNSVEGANVAPYFIGVFDTVAALGAKGLARWMMLAVLLSVVFAIPTWVIRHYVGTIDAGTYVLGVVIVLGVLMFRARFKMIGDYPAKGKLRWHFSGWRSGFYDRFLDKRVRFARHALAIDERRLDFARVEWGVKGDHPVRENGEGEWFKQIWFAGNHSDIGGSYSEDESRLSDIALDWMVREATSIPYPMIVDSSKLHVFPSCGGMQHCEIQGMRDRYPTWVPKALRFTWREKERTEVLGSPLHPTVLDRFALASVIQSDQFAEYRPESLRKDPRVELFYAPK